MLALLSFFLSVIPASVVAQAGDSQVPIVYNAEHNATNIIGTWSTGSGAVQTGPGFANPVNFSFHYPKTTGRSYSFTSDMHFEQAEYRFASNASDPHCITGVVTWQHGEYQLLDNGSIVLNPIPQDGRQQVQDPCAAISNQLTQWNTTVLFQSWRIFALPDGVGFHLHLFEYDGKPVAPMNLIARPPNMLPTSVLTITNDTSVAPAAKTGTSKRGVGIEARSDASRPSLVVGGLAGLAGLSAMLMILL